MYKTAVSTLVNGDTQWLTHKVITAHWQLVDAMVG